MMHVMKCFSVELDASSFEIAIRRLEIGNTVEGEETVWKAHEAAKDHMSATIQHKCIY
jgi:hypothetical protein